MVVMLVIVVRMNNEGEGGEDCGEHCYKDGG